MEADLLCELVSGSVRNNTTSLSFIMIRFYDNEEEAEADLLSDSTKENNENI